VTKLIAILIVAVAVYAGWKLFSYYEHLDATHEADHQPAQAAGVSGDQLPGLPSELEASFKTAKAQGPAALKDWLKTNASRIQDPRKAWIELDYCVSVSQKDPDEARRVFAEVKRRTPETSPVWPRLKSLTATYE
jgi:hypothetical protein